MAKGMGRGQCYCQSRFHHVYGWYRRLRSNVRWEVVAVVAGKRQPPIYSVIPRSLLGMPAPVLQPLPICKVAYTG